MNGGRGAARVRVIRYSGDRPRARRDLVAAEEPLEIRLSYAHGGRRTVRSVGVTMRTPGHDVELSVGYLFAERVIDGRGAVLEVAHCAGDGPQNLNVVEVRLASSGLLDEARLERSSFVSSSCGVCGKAALEHVEARAPIRPIGTATLSADWIAALPARLNDSQGLFRRTGGLHAAAIFDAGGALLAAHEDVGRHNAVDKVVGRCVLEDRIPFAAAVLVVSGRTSFEILQKAVAAGVCCVVAVGAPSSLAVEVARRFDVTLVGFARAEGFNVYAAEHRLT